MKRVILYWSNQSSAKDAISVSNFLKKTGSFYEQSKIRSLDDPSVTIVLCDSKKRKLVEGDYKAVCEFIKNNIHINEHQTNSRTFSDDLGFLTPVPPIDF